MNEEVLLTIYNNHADLCPCVSNRDQESENKYLSYYENEHGEQWLFIYDKEIEKGVLRGGDVGWDSVYDVGDDGSVDLVLTLQERAWLLACFKTATSFKKFREKNKVNQ